MLIARSLCIKLMEDALQEPVRIECGPDVARFRQCFYRARRYCDSWGDDRFKYLRFRIDGTELVIERHPDPDAVRQRYKLRALREAVSYALSRGKGSQDGQPDKADQ
jgi:hypothetical protein